MGIATVHAAEALPALGRIVVLVWPFWLILGAFALLRIAVHQAGERRLRSSGISELDSMSLFEFDRRIGELLGRLGYEVGRGGNELVVERDGRRAVVRTVHGDSADEDVIHAVRAAATHHGADEAWVVTSGDFTRSALRLATREGVDLWNRERLVAALRRANRTAVARRDMLAAPDPGPTA